MKLPEIATRRRSLSAELVAVCAVAVMLLAFVQRLPCVQNVRGAGGQLELDWSNQRPFVDYCYSDVIALYGDDHIEQSGAFPYKTSWIENAGTPAQQVHYVEYPVLTGLFMWVGGRVADGYEHLARDGLLPARLNVTVYFYFMALCMALAWLLVVRFVGRLAGGDRRPALLVAVSPLVIDQLFTNFDAPAVLLATGALLAWSRRRALLTGALLGLGGAAKLYPLLLLIPLLALCLRAGELRAGARAVAGAAGAWIVVNAPIAILFPSGWSYFYRLSSQRGVGLESLFNVVPFFTGSAGLDPNLGPNQTPVTVNAVSGAGLVVACLAICWLAMRAPVRPRLPQLCLLVIVAFLLTSKIYSPQYSLWLVPLAALALPRWRVLVPWMTLDALVWVPTMLFQRQAVSEGLFLAVVLARDAALLTICAIVVREIYRPERDLVRRGGVDDPCGGLLDGAPDRFTLRGRSIALT